MQYREEIRKLKRELALAKEQNQAMAVTKTTDSEKLEIYQETVRCFVLALAAHPLVVPLGRTRSMRKSSSSRV